MADRAADVSAAFARVPYLRALPDEEQTTLAQVCAVQDVSRGARLFLEDEEAPGIFLILNGRVKLVRSSADGREQVLHEETSGATLAEAPVFGGGGCVGTAVAVEDSVVLFVPRVPLLAMVERHPASARAVMRILAGRLRALAAVVEDLSLRDVRQRTAGYLLREFTRTGVNPIELPPTREELAAHVGTVREQVSRALTQLKAAGAIEVDGRKVTITNLARLRNRG